MLQSVQKRPDFADTIRVLQTQGIMGKGQDNLSKARFYRGVGCAQCHGSGFAGRIGLFELFEITEEMRDLIMARQPASVIRAAAIRGGMKTLFQDGVAKALLGETTIDEVFRVAL